jgi:uncharacterized membrane protein YqaE (UPF0057 family)
MRFIPLLLLILASFISLPSEASIPVKNAVIDRNAPTYVNDDMAQLLNVNMEAFLKMTPKEFKKMTGRQLTFKETLKLKAAQKLLKKSSGGDSQVPKGLYIVLALFGWAWLAMGIMDDWEGKNWWLNLILTMLCGIPGLIHALVHMKDYYGGK